MINNLHKKELCFAVEVTLNLKSAHSGIVTEDILTAAVNFAHVTLSTAWRFKQLAVLSRLLTMMILVEEYLSHPRQGMQELLLP